MNDEGDTGIDCLDLVQFVQEIQDYTKSDGASAFASASHSGKYWEEPEVMEPYVRKKTLNRVADVADKVCKRCRTRDTPVWRWGGDNKDTLFCNACFLRRKRLGPKASLKKELESSRQKKLQAAAAQQAPPEPNLQTLKPVDQLQELSARRSSMGSAHSRQQLDVSSNDIEPLVFSEEDRLQLSPVSDLGPGLVTPNALESSMTSQYSRERLTAFMMQEKARLEGHLPGIEECITSTWVGPESESLAAQRPVRIPTGPTLISWPMNGYRIDRPEWPVFPTPHPCAHGPYPCPQDMYNNVSQSQQPASPNQYPQLKGSIQDNYWDRSLSLDWD